MAWMHAICDQCWDRREPRRVPVRVEDVDPAARCCVCGAPCAGIYVRHNPQDRALQHCGGHDRPEGTCT
jgi:hypothetical protein